MPNLYNTFHHVRDVVAVEVATSTPYDSFARMGVTITVVTAAISLICVTTILGLLGNSFFKRRYLPSGHFFVRTHAAAYFTCLLMGDLLQTVATLMSIKWIKAGGVSLDMFCSAQGAIKNAGNLSISLWTLMLAIHTFCVLFFRWKPKDWVLYSTLIGVWFFIGFIVVIGPGAVQKPDKGPFFGISGYWCWIADPYPTERIVFEYLWLLGSAGISFILYILTFLRLRGNIHIQDKKIRFCRISSDNEWNYMAGRDSADIQMTAVARGMIGFPILFTVIVLPIAICRFVAWSGRVVPVEATIFSDAVFSLTGVFDLILFVSTRSLLPPSRIMPWWFSPRPKISNEITEYGVQPYNVKDFASAHGFNEMDHSHAERTMATLPPRNASITRPLNPSLPKRSLSFTGPPPGLTPPSGRVNPDTMKNVTTSHGQRDSNLEHADPRTPSAWDEVDLEHQGQPDRSTMSDSSQRSHKKDTRYTVFSLSAYGYNSDTAETPPMPSGAGIDASAGRNYRNDDMRSLSSGGTHQERDSFASSTSSMSYDLRSSEIKSPPPAARWI